MAHTRLNVNVNGEVADALQELAARHHTTVTDIIHRAASVFYYLDDKVVKEGFALQLVRGDEVITVSFQED
jgi:hypothetical protein